MKRLAIIPARGGSKRIHHKNIRDFCGQPMITHVLDTARESGLFSVIHVSTECQSVREVVSIFGFPPDFSRPESLADDHTPIMPVLRTRETHFLFSSFVLDFNAFLVSGKHQPEERKTAMGPIQLVFLLGPTQTSFSFPPAGTPEATSWEQGQMARPHLASGHLFLVPTDRV